jgi:Tfp pilus assembly protein PilF
MLYPVLLILMGFTCGSVSQSLYERHRNNSIEERRDAFALSAMMRASDARAQKDYEDAIAFLNRAMGIAPQWYAPHMGLAFLYQERGETAKACEKLREAYTLIQQGHYGQFGRDAALHDGGIISEKARQWSCEEVLAQIEQSEQDSKP